MIEICIHATTSNGQEIFHHSVKFIPHKYDRISLSLNGPVYEVDYTLYNLFGTSDEIEIYCHEVN
ncbi:MAG: hypothetical protein HFH04_03060 [Dorea sp.]|nr:hypothetical protein [Dorea sp.]